MFDIHTLSTFPQEPGVYLMYGEQDRMLYIGKSKNLRTRIKQYFIPGHDTRPMIDFLRQEIVHIETIVVKNEKEALILENNLIKKHKPKYNIFLKDDKTYVSLQLTHHKWPMLRLVRYKNKPKGKGKFFGPYTNAKAARETLDLILHLFPLRQCSDRELINRTRPCLLFGMKKCVAPCIENCTKKEYDQYVHSATDLLLGKDKSVIAALKKEMHRASKALEFEKAHALLEMIQSIDHITQIQHVDNPFGKNTDVIGIYRKDNTITIALLLFREGKLLGAKHFTFSHIFLDDAALLETFLLQYYKTSFPKIILTPLAPSHKALLEEIFSHKTQEKVSIATPIKGKRKELILLAQKNAEAQFLRAQQKQSLQEKYLLSLQETFSLINFPKKIFCFDTSHIASTDPVAAMVTFINGKNMPEKQKLFKIKTTAQGDVPAMKEVLIRHFSRNDLCDLLIVDGGKAQLNIALQILKDLDIASVDVIGVAKEKGRHDKGLTQEQIFLPYQKDPILLPKNSPLLFLLQNIRDQAHKIAINYHKKRREKRFIASSLDDIAGIGPIKKKRLLAHFKSVERIKNASQSELSKIPGLTKTDIQNLMSLKNR